MDSTLSLVASVLTTLAAVLVAVNAGARLTGIGFIVFAAGSVFWIASAALSDQANLLWQNAVLLVINLVGVWRWLGLRARYAKGAQRAGDAS